MLLPAILETVANQFLADTNTDLVALAQLLAAQNLNNVTGTQPA
jgi:hypothetical protein